MEEVTPETDQENTNLKPASVQVAVESAQEPATKPQQKLTPATQPGSASNIPAPIKTSISTPVDSQIASKSPLGIASPLTSIRTSIAKKQGKSPSPRSVSRPDTPQLVANSPLGMTSTSSWPTQMTPPVDSEQVQANIHVNISESMSAPTPLETKVDSVPVTPTQATSKAQLHTISESTPTGISTPSTTKVATSGKPSRPKKKLKLGKNTALLSLVKQDDIDWWKQQASSSPTASSPGPGGALSTPSKTHGFETSVSQPVTPSVDTAPKLTDLPAEDSMPMDVDSAPAETVQTDKVDEPLRMCLMFVL